MTDQKLTFRYDLQGLRAIAVLLVILAHAGLDIVKGGFIGVDVFFVLSGYLITGFLLRELEQNGRIAFMRFYARRLKRLLPSLILMLSVSASVAIWFLSEVEANKQLASSTFAATWTSNLYFAFTQIDYFDELASRDLFLHTWSLGVEEQFYLIWPALLVMFFWGSSFQQSANQNRFKLMLPGLVIVFIASFILSIYWTINTPQAAFYLMPSRIWQFSIGAIVFLAFWAGNPLYSNRLTQGFSNLLTLGIGLILIVGSAIALNPNLAYPGFWALAPSFGAALVIVAGHMPNTKDSLLAHPILVWLGDRSYSLYLWHWPIFMLGFSMGFQGQLLPTLGMILLSMLAAILSFQFIELPFWRGRWSHAQPTRIILVSLLMMAAVIFAIDYGLRQFTQLDAATAKSRQWKSDMPEIYDRKCDAFQAHSRVEPCFFGSDAAKKTVVFLGDSIGVQWFSMIPQIYPEPLWRIIVLTKSACAMVDEDFYYPSGKINQVCTDWRNGVLNKLDALKPDVLIMGSAATYKFSETEWIEGSSRVFERVSKAAIKVFVIPGTPSLGFDGPGCLSRNPSPEGEGHINSESCIAKNRLKHIEAVTKLLGKTADRFSNVHILDLNDLVCPAGNCSAISEEGVVVFRDSQHLTDSFVRVQVPIVGERLKRLYKD